MLQELCDPFVIILGWRVPSTSLLRANEESPVVLSLTDVLSMWQNWVRWIHQWIGLLRANKRTSWRLWYDARPTITSLSHHFTPQLTNMLSSNASQFWLKARVMVSAQSRAIKRATRCQGKEQWGRKRCLQIMRMWRYVTWFLGSPVRSHALTQPGLVWIESSNSYLLFLKYSIPRTASPVFKPVLFLSIFLIRPIIALRRRLRQRARLHK